MKIVSLSFIVIAFLSSMSLAELARHAEPNPWPDVIDGKRARDVVTDGELQKAFLAKKAKYDSALATCSSGVNFANEKSQLYSRLVDQESSGAHELMFIRVLNFEGCWDRVHGYAVGYPINGANRLAVISDALHLREEMETIHWTAKQDMEKLKLLCTEVSANAYDQNTEPRATAASELATKISAAERELVTRKISLSATIGGAFRLNEQRQSTNDTLLTELDNRTANAECAEKGRQILCNPSGRTNRPSVKWSECPNGDGNRR